MRFSARMKILAAIGDDDYIRTYNSNNDYRRYFNRYLITAVGEKFLQNGYAIYRVQYYVNMYIL